MNGPLFLTVCLIALIAYALYKARSVRDEPVIDYVDEGANSQVFSHPVYRIRAKPDVLETLPNGGRVLREYKSRQRGFYFSDKVQIMATALAVRGSGLSVSQGILETANGERHAVSLTGSDSELFREIAPIVEQTRLAIAGVAPLPSPSTGKCARCSYRDKCPYSATLR